MIRSEGQREGLMKAIADRLFHPDAPQELQPMVGSGSTTEPTPSERRIPRRLVLKLPDGRELPLLKNLSIGQSSRNDVVVRDERVSRRHCVIEWSDGVVRVRDL